MTNVTFEDSNDGICLDGDDNRNVTVMFNHAETCTGGILHFIGSGLNTTIACNFVDTASLTQRSNPPFQKVLAFLEITMERTPLKPVWIASWFRCFCRLAQLPRLNLLRFRCKALHPRISRRSAPTKGILPSLSAGCLLQQENNQFNGGARIAAIAEGSVNEDKLGILFQVRKGISNLFSSVMHLTTSGALLPWVDNDQDLGSRNFFNGSVSVNKRWRNGYFSGVVSTGGYTVSTLPANPGTGARAYVTDATSPTYLGALTGGGSVVCPVFYNGSAWVSA